MVPDIFNAAGIEFVNQYLADRQENSDILHGRGNRKTAVGKPLNGFVSGIVIRPVNLPWVQLEVCLAKNTTEGAEGNRLPLGMSRWRWCS